MIEASFSRASPPAEHRRISLARKRESGLWQRRYWKPTIRDGTDCAAHMDHVHFNPVKHGLAVSAADWPFSSFAQCVRLGSYPASWAMREAGPTETGERF